MKRLLFRLRRHAASRRTPRRAPPAGPVSRAIHGGALIGFAVCLLGALAVGSPAGPALWAALFGAGIGALNGLLLWLGSDQLDEQPVVPPHRADRREPSGPAGRRPMPGRTLHHGARHPVHPRAGRQR